MRKIPCKWFLWLTIFGFIPPLFYLFFRIGKPDIFSFQELASMVVGGVFISIIVWGVYGISCLFARNWVNCEKCKFSEVIHNSEELKCKLTDYTYPKTFSCKKSKPKKINIEG